MTWDAYRVLLVVALVLCLGTSLTDILRKRRVATLIHIVALLVLAAGVVLHSIRTGRPPFATTLEFASTFALGIIGVALLLRKLGRSLVMVPAVSMGFAALMLLWVAVEYQPARSLVPALQNNPLFISHVGLAVIAYGAFTVSFAAAMGRLFVRGEGGSKASGRASVLDAVTYRSVLIGFPLFTLTLILGSVWADVAWGTFWSWDPKETASLVTWLVFAAYLHSRLFRGWAGKKAALLVVIGFLAVLATFLGNFVFSGLHAYN